MTEGLLAEAELCQALVPDHQVAPHESHLGDVLPLLAVLVVAQPQVIGVAVGALHAVLAHPRDGGRVLVGVEDPLLDPAGELAHVHVLGAHVQVVAEEVVLDDRPGDAHRDPTHRQVRPSAHQRHGQPGPGELQEPLANVLGEGVVAGVLDVLPVDRKGRDALLGIAGQHGSEIDRSGPLRAVEAEHRMRHVGVHVHGLGPVAPARRHGDREADTRAREQPRALCCLGDPADRGARDHALDGGPVRITELGRQELGDPLGEAHRLVLE